MIRLIDAHLRHIICATETNLYGENSLLRAPQYADATFPSRICDVFNAIKLGRNVLTNMGIRYGYGSKDNITWPLLLMV